MAAAAAAAAAVAANGNNCNFGTTTQSSEALELENSLQLLKSITNNNGLIGHDLNDTSELLNAATKLINGTAAAGGGGGGVPAMNGNGCQDPAVSTTQVTIPKDVSRGRGWIVRRIKRTDSFCSIFCSWLERSLARRVVVFGEFVPSPVHS